MTNATLRQALAYAERGWPVFPCQANRKIPATTHGYQDATTDEQQITDWFTRRPGYNLAIATAAGLVPATVRDLAYGRRRSARGTAAAILSMNPDAIPRDRVDAGGTRLRLRALHVMGHGCARIAHALGVREATIQDLVRGDARTVSPRLRDKVITLYDAWWDKRAPERTRFERGAATAARKRAIAGNWCAGAGLDDDQLDTPGYRPSQGWKPARGTGIAADIRLPARHPHRKRRGA